MASAGPVAPEGQSSKWQWEPIALKSHINSGRWCDVTCSRMLKDRPWQGLCGVHREPWQHIPVKGLGVREEEKEKMREHMRELLERCPDITGNDSEMETQQESVAKELERHCLLLLSSPIFILSTLRCGKVQVDMHLFGSYCISYIALFDSLIHLLN